MVNTTNFEKAMKAALEGPEVKKIKIEKHEFNVKPVKSIGDRVTGPMWKGQISHHLSFRDDDQVYYEFQVNAGQTVTIEQVKVQLDESWMQKIAGDLVESLGEALKEWLTEKGKEKLDASTKALATNSEDAQRRIFEESKHLLDGSWLGDVKFMIVNIAGRLAIRQAQVVYRQSRPPTRPVPRPTRQAPRDYRTRNTLTVCARAEPGTPRPSAGTNMELTDHLAPRQYEGGRQDSVTAGPREGSGNTARRCGRTPAVTWPYYRNVTMWRSDLGDDLGSDPAGGTAPLSRRGRIGPRAPTPTASSWLCRRRDVAVPCRRTRWARGPGAAASRIWPPYSLPMTARAACGPVEPDRVGDGHDRHGGARRRWRVDKTGALAWTWARTGLMVAVLMTLGVAGCGDDDDGSTRSETGSEQADDPGDSAGGSGGESSDLCSLLTTAEVEAQFGEAGAVADPRLELGSCVWEIGGQGEDGSGDLFTLYRFVGDSSRSLGENWGIDLTSSGESLDGIGDEAWINDDGSQLLLNRGDVYVSLSNAFGSVIGSDLAGVREKMIALAELVAGRI